MSKLDEAALVFGKGFNCAQSVFSVFCDELGVDQETALKISSGFGGGMCQGEICGAVAGAVMALGYKYGQSKEQDKQAKQKANEMVKEFCNRFKEVNNSIVCKELLGIDLSKENARAIALEKGLFKTICPKMIQDSVKILEDIL